ncbi:hypothetical protein BX666DRAFT_1880273 [Dichotomocladium elegans]|nr:hypothetical protein BX666DRAFT_1880273 [Dichotomocladium elegans]
MESVEAVVYAPREEISDPDWTDAIFLGQQPHFLTKVKENSGCYEDEDEGNNNNDSFATSSLRSLFPGVPLYKYVVLPLHTHARLLILRVYPNIQLRLEYMCRAYFRKSQYLIPPTLSEKHSNSVCHNAY